MKFFANTPLKKLANMRAGEKIEKELKVIPESYIPHRLGEDVLSYDFIEMVQALEKDGDLEKITN